MKTTAEKAALAKAILGTKDVSVEEMSATKLSGSETIAGVMVGRVISADFSGKIDFKLDGESVFSVDNVTTPQTSSFDSGVIAYDEVISEEASASNGVFLRDGVFVSTNL